MMANGGSANTATATQTNEILKSRPG
jgi:hypothetical protein